MQAGAEGKEIEFKLANNGAWLRKGECTFGGEFEYRIAKPKATPLPITPEMWAMIDTKYKFAYLNHIGDVWFSVEELKWDGGAWDLKGLISNHCESPLAIDTAGIVPELSMTERQNDVAPDNKRKLRFVKQDRLLDIYADFLREAGATQDNHADATHYAESMAGDHVELYKKMPDKWMIWNYDLRLWQPVQIFGAEPNPIK